MTASKKIVVSKIAPAAIIILLVGISGVLGYQSTLPSSDLVLAQASLKNLQSDYDELQVQMNNLNASYASLLSIHESLIANYTSLLHNPANTNVSYNALLAQLNSLNSSYVELQSDYKALTTNYGSLLQNMTDAESLIDSLRNQMSSLQTSYSSLESEYAELMSNHTSLQNSMSSLQTSYNASQGQTNVLQTSYSNLNSRYNTLLANYNSLLAELYPTLPADYGWSGYIESTSEVVPLLDRLQADGWNTIRYQSTPDWALEHHVGYYSTLNQEVLDLLVNEATERNMTVYLLCAHCWVGNDLNSATGGSGPFIDGHEQEWIDLWLDLGERYEDKNVVIDAWSEYSHILNDTRYQPLAQSLVDALRDAGIDTQIHFNIWWNGHIFALNDPIDNYSLGRHLYGGKYDNYNPSFNATTTLDFETVCQDSGIDADMDHYFEGTDRMFYQEAKKLGVNFVISEMGASNTYNITYASKYSMSVGNVAYAMRLLQIAEQYGVPCIVHRVGVYDDYHLYYYYAMKYFGQSFWEPS